MINVYENQFPSKSELEFHCSDFQHFCRIGIFHHHSFCFLNLFIGLEQRLLIAQMDSCTRITPPTWEFGNRCHIKFNVHANLHFRKYYNYFFNFTLEHIYSIGNIAVIIFLFSFLVSISWLRSPLSPELSRVTRIFYHVGSYF